MKIFTRKNILRLLVLNLIMIGPAVSAASPASSGRSMHPGELIVAMAIPPQPTLDDAVMLVQAQTDGRILSAREVLFEGYFVYEIKVMRNGRVEVIRVRSSTSN